MKTTKKLFLPIIMLLMFTLTSTHFCEVIVWAALQPGGIKIYMDDEPISFSQEPVIVDGQPMLPVKEVAEAAGWNYTERMPTLVDLIKTVKYTDGLSSYLFSLHTNTIDLDRKRMDKNIMVGAGNFLDTPADHNISFTVEPVIINGSLMVCVDDVALCLYASYIWDESNQALYITNGKIPYIGGQDVINREEIINKWKAFHKINGALTPVNEEDDPLSILSNWPEIDSIKQTLSPTPITDIDFTPTGVLTSPPEEGSVLANILLPGKSNVTISDSFYKPYKIFVGHGCNWYAFGRFYETYGYQVPIQYTGGDTYLDVVEEANSTIIKAERNPENIVSGSIAVYRNQSGGGHVVFVEYIERDENGSPEYVYYTECMNSDDSGIYKPQEDGQVKKVTFERFLKSASGTKDLIGLVMPIK